MWWKAVTFCILVSIVVFVVITCIGRKPSSHLVLHRCCEEGIENDEIFMETFRHNFLRERLTATERDEESLEAEELIQLNVLTAIETVRDTSKESEEVSDYKSSINVHNINERKTLLVDDNKNIKHELIEEFTLSTPDRVSGEEVTVKTYYTENVSSI